MPRKTGTPETFGLPENLIITQKEYETRTGKPVDWRWLPPLPTLTLTLAESIEALERARTIITTIEKEAEAELEQIKTQSKSTEPGRRGKYVTERVTAEIHTRIAAAHVQKIRPPKINDEEWTTRMQIALTDLTPQAQSLNWPTHSIPIYATAVLAMQYAKREDQISSQISSATQNHPQQDHLQ